ncbi:MAG: hypothetical protein ABJB39_03820 [Chloroflexota bacterium]
MYGGAWGQLWLAATLILIGVVFLLRNYSGLEIGHWWALFILIPAAATLARAYTSWRSGIHPSAVSGQLIAGLVMVSVAAIFLLDLQWSKVWPVFLILIGIGALLPSLIARSERPREEDAASRG